MYLIIDNVTKIFPPRGGAKEVRALDGITIEINKGEFVTLLGPSGCGKTTTLRMVAGFDYPTSGNIILDGKNIIDVPTHKRDMSMVFQSYAIFPHLNVYENIAYGLNVQKMSREEQQKRINVVLEMVHLEGYETRAPNQLSGGQQQRVALARALVMEPKVLLMDEPLSNLDTKLREQMRFEIRQLQRQLGFTCLYVTHDQLEAMVLSDKAVVMNLGKIEHFGSPREIYRYPKTKFVADFIGRANFLEGIVVEKHGETLVVMAEGNPLRLNDPNYVDFSPGDQVDVIIRPEMVKVRLDEGVYEGKILQAAYLGESVEYVVDVNGTQLSVQESDPTRLELIPEGTPVKVSFTEACLHVLKKE